MRGFRVAAGVLVSAAAFLLPASPASADPFGLGADVSSVGDRLLSGRRNAIVRASERVGPSVVTVSILKAQLVEGPAFAPHRDFFDSFFFRNLRRRYWQRVSSIGSGVVVREDGVIITNYHVVQGAQEIKITLADGREYPARFVGGEELYDLAILRAETGGDRMPVAPLDDSGELMVGEWAIAIGNPFGYLLGDPHPTVTVGVVSATSRDILPDQGNSDTLYKDMIQTDAAINPGNSGGALVNAMGEVVGINTFIFSRSGGSHGIGFAIPIATARRVMDEILEHGTVREVWVGIRVQEIPTALAESLDLDSTDGVIVASVEDRSPADRAGVRRGDVIVRINRERIRNFEDARRALYGMLVGDEMVFFIKRGGGEPERVELRLTEREMIGRYTRPEMGMLFEDQTKFETWLEIEIAILEALAERGHVPAEDVTEIKKLAEVDAERIAEIEQETNHDVVAFLTNVGESVGPAARWVHLGVTSSDVVDTSWSLLLKRAGERLLREVDRLRAALVARASEHRHTPMVGRTHGVHAEPTTFGLKLAIFWRELGRDRERLERAIRTIGVGKVSGAVGTFAHLDPEIEASACARLGLEPAGISSQILQRDRHAEFAFALAITGATLEKIALEVRHLHRTEVREVQEQFTSKQAGSSSMPHKRNPILCERICGLARLLRGNLTVALENVALWHERDISHSSAERVILPDGCILLDYLLAKTTALVENLVVYPENMQANLEKMRGLIYSQNLLLDLVRAGKTRGEAYRAVQRAGAKVWDEDLSFLDAALADPEITDTLATEDVEESISLARSLRNVDRIFERIRIFENDEERVLAG